MKPSLITIHFVTSGFPQPMGLGTNMDSGVASLQSEKPSSIGYTQQPPLLASEAPITPKNPLDLSAGRGKRCTNTQICTAKHAIPSRVDFEVTKNHFTHVFI